MGMTHRVVLVHDRVGSAIWQLKSEVMRYRSGIENAENGFSRWIADSLKTISERDNAREDYLKTLFPAKF